MSISTLSLGGGSYLGVGLRQATEIEEVSTAINTFNGLSVTFYSPYGETVAILTAGRGNGNKLESELVFNKYGGLISFNINVLRNTDIPFFNGMNVRFYYKNKSFAYGYINVVPPTDQDLSIIVLDGVGYTEKLKDKKVTETYSSSTVSAILTDLGSTYFLDLGIGYNPTKIQPPVLSVLALTWDDKSIITIINDLISMCNTSFEDVEYIYGIDEHGDFYFKGIGDNEIKDAYFEGFKFQGPETENDAENIINQIKLFRTTSGDNKATEYVNTYSDSTSQDQYGLYEKKVTIADYVDNTTAANIANGIIADWKYPKIRVTANDLLIDNVLPFGFYNVTNKKQDQQILISEFASSTEWTETFATATSDIIDTNVYTGRLCYELTLNSSEDDYFTKAVEYYMPTKLRVYIRQSTAGEYLSMSVTGQQANSLHALYTDTDVNIVTDTAIDLMASAPSSSTVSSVNINVPFTNEWTYVELDLSGWVRIDSVVFTVIDNGTNTILLDRLEIFTNSYVSRNLSLETIKYQFGQNSVKCQQAVFGIKKLTLTEKLDKVDEKNNIPYDIFSKQ